MRRGDRSRLAGASIDFTMRHRRSPGRDSRRIRPSAPSSSGLRADMDQDREQERRTYFLCRMGFAVLAFALIVASGETLVSLPIFFGARAFLPLLQHSTFWHWLDVPIVWGSLIGAYLLWGRWSEPSWQRRTGLLVLMSTVDLVLWFLDHGNDLGLRLGDVGHQWFRSHLGNALGWAEFALMASLTCDVMVHLGVDQAAETGRATRSLAATGAVVWMLLFCQETDWQRGWPLEERGARTLETLLLRLGWHMIWTITLIQVTALTIAATRQCTGVLRQIDQEDNENDLLRSASEKDDDQFLE